MIYNIQCSFAKKIEQSPLTTSDEFLYLNLETSSFAIVKGLVRHNFNIQKDTSAYI
jgi:DNA-dependent RNA polymerase auxiliary subunit epsilon